MSIAVEIVKDIFKLNILNSCNTHDTVVVIVVNIIIRYSKVSVSVQMLPKLCRDKKSNTARHNYYNFTTS